MTKPEKPGVPLTPSQWEAIYGPRHGGPMTILDKRSNPCREARFATPPITKPSTEPPTKPPVEPPVKPLTKPSAPVDRPLGILPAPPKIIVRIMGGLGNQLFGYAFGISIAKARKENVGFTLRGCGTDEYHLTNYLLDAFVDDIKLLPKYVEAESVFSDYLRPLGSFGFDPEVYTTKSTTFVGYWQTEKYFDVKLVRQKVSFRYPLGDQSQRVAESITRVGKASTFLHVRRGLDYLNRDRHHGVMSMKYYNEAVRRVKESYENAHFFVFGDNLPWMREQFFGSEFTIVGHIEPGSNATHEDMHLMSLCQNGIIANSSFSWWGAWLGDTQTNRLIFAPERWLTDPKIDFRGIIPDRWTKLEV
jgi:Glycosyl transferase family 11